VSRAIRVTVGPLAAASANNIALTQTPLAAGNITLNGALVVGGVATLDRPRRVIVTSAGNDSTVTFTAYGTDFSGQALVASVSGAAIGAADFGVSFATITRITTSAATAAAITVGTNGIADSRPICLDIFGFAPCALQVVVSGTVNYTVQQSMDNPNRPIGNGTVLGLAGMTWSNSADTGVVGVAATAMSNFAYAPHFVKLVLNSGTGSATMTIVQHASPSI
jgi:hypothetical protein